MATWFSYITYLVINQKQMGTAGFLIFIKLTYDEVTE